MKESTRMIKVSLLWLLVLGLALAMAACGGDDRRGGPSNNESNQNVRPGPDAGGEDADGPGEEDASIPDADPQTDTDPGPGPGGCTDLSPTIPGDECDPLCQTGCETGQNCVALTTTESTTPMTQCQPAGTSGQGGSCGAETGCQVGHLCATFEAGTPTTCYQACRPVAGGEPACPQDYVCVGYMTEDTRVGICVLPDAECTFYPNDSCGAGENCYQTSLGERCIAYDAEAAVGSSCASPTDCNDAQACLSPAAGQPATCRAMCESDADCGGAEGSCGGILIDDGTGQGVEAPYGACVE
ncbi:MAG: hypothetical protein ACNA8W_02575 [Bradymonadaceae bacterium]